MKIVGATGSGGLWALEWARHIRVTSMKIVGVAYSRNKFALRTRLRNSILYLW